MTTKTKKTVTEVKRFDEHLNGGGGEESKDKTPATEFNTSDAAKNLEKLKALKEQVAAKNSSARQTTGEEKKPVEQQQKNGAEKQEQKTEPKQIENEQEKLPEAEGEEKEFIIDFTNIDFNALFHGAFNQFVDDNRVKLLTDAVKPLVEEAAKKFAKPTVITIGDRKPITIQERTHKAFEDCLFITQHERKLFMSGSAGTGKTTIAAQIAKAMKLPFAHISCSAGLSEGHLLGRMLFDGQYVVSDFVNIYENGGVFLFDECDAADANTMLVINSALANGYISVPNRRDKTTAQQHKDFVCICAANTWGYGSFEYQGRNHLDAAFLDRFAVAKQHIDYDTELEKEICDGNKELFDKLNAIRKAICDNKLRKILSTRAFVSGTRQMKAGKTLNQVLEVLTLGWSNEEKAKCNVK